MPTYDYECKSCGYTFEYFQSMSDQPLKTCPQCGKEVRRLIGGGLGIIFKGSGFYVTDNKGAASSVAPGSSASEGGKASEHQEEPAESVVKKAETKETPQSSKEKISV